MLTKFLFRNNIPSSIRAVNGKWSPKWQNSLDNNLAETQSNFDMGKQDSIFV